MNATLKRTKTGDTGTFGTLTLDDGKTFVTGELPWRNNAPQKSCIPTGTYRCSLYNSPTKGVVYMVEHVPGRDYILIHPANFFGDKAKGFRVEMLGCIGLGRVLGKIDGQDAVLSSKVSVADFQARQGGEPFELTIVDETGRAA